MGKHWFKSHDIERIKGIYSGLKRDYIAEDIFIPCTEKNSLPFTYIGGVNLLRKKTYLETSIDGGLLTINLHIIDDIHDIKVKRSLFTKKITKLSYKYVKGTTAPFLITSERTIPIVRRPLSSFKNENELKEFLAVYYRFPISNWHVKNRESYMDKRWFEWNALRKVIQKNHPSSIIKDKLLVLDSPKGTIINNMDYNIDIINFDSSSPVVKALYYDYTNRHFYITVYFREVFNGLVDSNKKDIRILDDKYVIIVREYILTSISDKASLEEKSKWLTAFGFEELVKTH